MSATQYVTSLLEDAAAFVRLHLAGCPARPFGGIAGRAGEVNGAAVSHSTLDLHQSRPRDHHETATEENVCWHGGARLLTVPSNGGRVPALAEAGPCSHVALTIPHRD